MSVNTEIGLDLMLSIDNPAKAAAEIEKIIGGGTIAGLDEGMRKAQGKVQKHYYEALVGALRLSNKEVSKNLQEEFKQRTDKIKEIGSIMQRQQRMLEVAERRNNGRMKHRLKERLAANRRRIAEEQKAIEKMSKTQTDALKDRLELLDEGLGKAGTKFGEKLEASAQGFEGIMQQALSAENLDFGGIVKGLGGALKEGSSQMMAGGAKMAAKGGAGGMLGKAAMALGAAAGTIAGAAAAIGAVVGLFAAAYGQTKEFNKAIADATGALDLMARGARIDHGDVRKAYTEVRHAVIDHAHMTRQATDAVMGNLTAMHESGFTFRQMQDTYGGYEQVLFQATSAMGTFGVEAAEVGTFLKTLTMDMGLGVEGIADAFDSVYGAAQLSSLSTKDFFTSISELTSGMALYNFRLEDTVELFTALEDTLGADAAKELLGGLKGKYRGMGFQERMVAGMKSGSAGRGVLEAATGRQQAAFEEKLKGRGDLQALLAEAGLMGEGGKLNMDKLATLRGAELGAVQNMLGDVGDEQALALSRSIDTLAEMARGSRGGATLGQRATAMGGLGMEGTLAMDMVGAFAVLGEKGIGDMEGIDRIAFEEMTGLGGEQFEAMKDIYNRQAAAMGGDVSLTDVAEAIASGEVQLKPEDRAALEAARKESMSQMEQIAVESLKETTSISQTLKNKVVGLLETSNSFLMSISAERGDEDLHERAQKREEFREAQGVLEDQRAQLAAEIEAGKTAGMGPEELAALEERMAAASSGAAIAGKGAAGGRVSEEMVAQYMAAALGVDTSRDALEAATGSRFSHDQDVYTRTVILPVTEGRPHGGVKQQKRKTPGDPEEGWRKSYSYQAFDEGMINLADMFTMATDQGLMEVKDPEGEKLQKKQVKETQESVRQLKKIRDALTRENYLDIASATGLGVKDVIGKLGSSGGKAALKQIIRDKIGELGDDDPEKGALRRALNQIEMTEEYGDFVYRGTGAGGTITPINRYDELLGMTTASRGGGAIIDALSRGSWTINNLTINESGDPKKTLAMVKQAIRAAQGA